MDIKKNQISNIKNQNFKNKRVLITAGPTWVPIDSVRAIGNIATGKTGILLAEELKNLGAKVTLLLGPVGSCCLDKKIKLVRFRFFDELENLIVKELKTKKYNIIIHSAAVSDYKPSRVYPGKMKSGIKDWKINLVPTKKIVDLIKSIDNSIFTVGFKFEPEAAKTKLIKESRKLLKRKSCDLVVANTLSKGRYMAHIVKDGRYQGPIFDKKRLVKKLMNNL